MRSEVIIYTKSKRKISVRIDLQPLPRSIDNKLLYAFIIFEDLSPYNWIEQQAERNKVLISGIIDRHHHVRFLRDRLAPFQIEPNQQMQDETLLQFIAETDHGKILKIIQEAHLQKKSGVSRLRQAS